MQSLRGGRAGGLGPRAALPHSRMTPDHVVQPRIPPSWKGGGTTGHLARLIPARSSAALDSGAGGGGGGGGGGDVPPSLTVAEDDSGDGPEQDAEAILAKHGVDPGQLPSDMQAALGRGAVTAADVELWLKLSAAPGLGFVCRLLPFIRDRVMGNPRFLLVLAIEEVIGVTAKMAAEVQGRGDAFWQELHFVASDIALEIIGDFAVVCLLSPKRSFAPPPATGLGRAISSLPGHAFQIGPFSLLQRLATVAYRGGQFFSVGCLSSMLGHSLTKWSVERQQRAHPKAAGEEPYKPLAPVLENSVTWGAFMAASTNVRYQLVNGLEERLLDLLVRSEAVKAGVTFLLRFGNTFFGGAQWVWYARVVGLQ